MKDSGSIHDNDDNGNINCGLQILAFDSFCICTLASEITIFERCQLAQVSML